MNKVISFVLGAVVATMLAAVSSSPAQASSSVIPAGPDFNGDGFADLAVGVPFQEIPAGNVAGAVNVMYGSATGLQADSPADQFWNQDSPGVRDVAEDGDEFGAVLAWGDFDSNSFDDLAIGIPNEKVSSVEGAGAIAVLYGTGTGLQADAPPDDYWNENSTGVREVAELNDEFGTALAAGDFDADGFVDLAIGAPGENVSTWANAGGVSVLYGSASGLQAAAPNDDYWTQDSSGVRDKAEDADRFGTALAAADFDDNGYEDLAVGIFNEDVGTVAFAGATAVLYGAAGGLQAGAPDDEYWNQNSANVEDLAEANDEFGNSLAAGDFNEDGFVDLAIGVHFEGVGSVGAAGAVNVLYGSTGGLQATAPLDQFWTQDSNGVEDTSEEADDFAFSLAMGDFDGDGTADLSVGIPGEDPPLISGGAVEVLYGSLAGLQTDAPADQFWTQDTTDVQDAMEVGDSFGRALSGADLNSDGHGDLVVGIQWEDIELGGKEDAGAVAVLYGSAGGLQAVSPDDQFWNQDSAGVEDTAQSQEWFGAAVS